jgi:hypothetical protein
MRAGLIVGALLALAVAEPAHAQAPVPCDDIGGGKYECSWYRPGNGINGGSLVVVGTTTVGYLHQGRNWIVCQQKGGDMRNPEGDRNNWFGWTLADNNKWGWASPLDAQGGDDYGPFALAPNCNGAHGSPPMWSGVWGQPPPPGSPGVPAPAPAVDADRDGYPPATDCDDTNSRVHPGAPEIANDDIDQDCSGVDAAGLLSAVVGFAWTKRGSRTRITSLRVSEAPAGATVNVSCSGKRKGCPKPKTFTTSSRGSVSMTKMFRKRRLRSGAVVTVTVTAPNRVGRVRKYTIRRKGKPRTRTLCLAPGASKATKC